MELIFGTCEPPSSVSCGTSIPNVQGTCTISGNSCTKPCTGEGTYCSSGEICDSSTCKTDKMERDASSFMEQVISKVFGISQFIVYNIVKEFSDILKYDYLEFNF